METQKFVILIVLEYKSKKVQERAKEREKEKIMF
jgi:hypothetical protein